MMNPTSADRASEIVNHLVIAAMALGLLASYLFLFAVFKAEPELSHAVAGQASHAAGD